MNEIVEFMMAHPFISLFMLWAICSCISNIIFRPWNRLMRHLNIRKAGWPPAHCDADGDFKPEPKATGKESA